MIFDSQNISPNFDLLDLFEFFSDEYSTLFQSSLVNQELGQFDFLFSTDGFYPATIEDLKKIDLSEQIKLASEIGDLQEKKLPFIGGHLIFIGYEFNQVIHPKLFIKNNPANLRFNHKPIYLAKVKSAFIVNHLKKKLSYLANDELEIKKMKDQVKRIQDTNKQNIFSKIRVQSKFNAKDLDDWYLNSVNTAKKHIYRGNVYQTNISASYDYELLNSDTAFNIYRSLKKVNPAPFSVLANFNDFSIISSSPERLLTLKNGELSTRPIAGTIERSKDKEVDKQLVNQLLISGKDKAEHIMLVDLERNDLSTIAQDHSLKVSQRFIETYSYVHHLVSEIKVKIRQDIDLFKLISAVFPGGSITGCPKIRCMEIIRDIEQQERFVYTGSIGYISDDGQMDLNILIRTFFLENNRLNLKVGAGIVADSSAQLELLETKNKALGLLKALQID